MPRQLPLDELTLALARIKGLLLTQETVERAVQLLAEGIRDTFPDSAGAGVSLMDQQGRRTSTGATDPVVEEADAAQYRLNQGPCIAAWATERTVIVTDVAADDRWPLWSRAIQDLPMRSVISSPLINGSSCLGALKIYATRAGAYDQSSARPLEKLAYPAATLLGNIQTSEAPQRFTEVLSEALDSRDTINRAQGFLMHLHGVTPEQALHELVRLARAGGQSLLTVSTEILEGRRST